MTTCADLPGAMPADPARLKSCCAQAYGSDVVALLLGESYHPGGLALTRRLATALGLRPGQRVLDIAAGPGATARLLSADYGARVDGIDLSPAAVAQARSLAQRAGLGDMARFHVGDAEQIPLGDGLFDAVVCECALCTFPDKPAAAAEIARVLRVGGRVGMTDISVGPGGLPAELSGIAGWVACIADARPPADYQAILAQAGLRTVRTEQHDAALQAMIDQIHTRLVIVRALQPERLAAAGVDIDAAFRHLEAARDAVTAGGIGYVMFVAEKCGPAGGLDGERGPARD